MKFNNVELTEETILKARRWFADNARECANEARDGTVRVNDLPAYLVSCGKREAEAVAGEYDQTFTFMQRAYYIQTGESVALLP